MSLSDAKFFNNLNIDLLSIFIKLSIKSQTLKQLRFKLPDQLIIKYYYLDYLKQYSKALDYVLGKKCCKFIFCFQWYSFRIFHNLLALFAPWINPFWFSLCKYFWKVVQKIWKYCAAVTVNRQLAFKLWTKIYFFIFAAFKYFFDHLKQFLIWEGEPADE